MLCCATAAGYFVLLLSATIPAIFIRSVKVDNVLVISRTVKCGGLPSVIDKRLVAASAHFAVAVV